MAIGHDEVAGKTMDVNIFRVLVHPHPAGLRHGPLDRKSIIFRNPLLWRQSPLGNHARMSRRVCRVCRRKHLSYASFKFSLAE